MQEFSLAYAITVLIIGGIAVMTGAWLVMRGPPTPAVRWFMLLMSFFATSAVMSAWMALSDNVDQSVLLAKMVVFTYVMQHGCYYELAVYLLPEEAQRPVDTKRWIFRAEVMMLAFISGYLVSDVRIISTGYAVGLNAGMVVGVCGSAMLIVGAAQKLFSYARHGNSQFRKQAWLLTLAMMSPMMFGGLIIVPSMFLGINIPSMLSIGFLGTIVLLIYTVYRYHLVMVTPQQELEACAPEEAKGLPELEKGSGYLVESKSSNVAYGLMLRELEGGAEGLIITREHPDHVRERNQLSSTPIIWLTTHPGPGRIEPTNMSVLQHTISEFLRKGTRPVLLLDGLEYLMVNDKAEKVMQLVQMIRDEVVVREAVLIVSVDGNAFTERELALLERDLDVICAGVPRTPGTATAEAKPTETKLSAQGN